MFKKIYISYLISFVIFLVYAYIFFNNVLVSIVISAIVSLKFYTIIYNIFSKNHEKTKRIMFREFLDIFNTNIISGQNFYNALKQTSLEIKNIFHEKVFIVKYLEELVLDIDNGANIIESLNIFKNKCDLEEVSIFVDSIIIAIKTGLDISDMTNISKDMLTENIALELEISTLVNNSKREFLIMTVLPIIILFLVNQNTANSLKLIDYIVRVPVFLVFLSAFYIGNKIVNMEI